MNKICKLLPLTLAASALATNTFFFNAAGYDSDQPISIVVQSTDELEGSEWTLFYAPDDPNKTGATVESGTFGKGENPDNWARSGKYYTVNLKNKLPYSGQYYLGNVGGSPSLSDHFTVGEKRLATATLGLVMDYFYNDRANNSTIMGWDQKVSVYGSSGVTRDVRGGWYDASGDVSKYFSHLSYANYLNPQQIPLTVWSLTFAAERIPALLESTPTKATAADEAAYGADFLVRMLDEQGFFYMTVFDNWGMGSRYLCAFTGSDGIKSKDYQTAFREGGGMAIAALARAAKLGVNGEFTGEQYLEAAKKAYAHLSEKQGIGQACAYCDDGKENIIDDYTALLAATELFATTGASQYLNDMEARATHLAERISNDGYFWSDDAKTRPFWHASDAGLPLIALVRFLEAETSIEREPCANADCALDLGDIAMEKALTAIKRHLSWLLSVTNEVENPFGYARQTYKTNNAIKDGFFIPHDNESGYWWQGEDARLASLATAAVYAARALNGTVADSVQKYAADQLDWILGKNPYSTSMMYGIGKKNPAIYDGQSNYDATLKGGIANGITGKNEDGSGIAWDDDGVAYVGFSSLEPWNNWRWIEQWLPHSTWYMMALTARYDEVTKPVVETGSGIRDTKIATAKGLNVRLQGSILSVNVSGAAQRANVGVYTLNGTRVATGNLEAGGATLDLGNIQGGIYLVKVEGLGVTRIAVK